MSAVGESSLVSYSGALRVDATCGISPSMETNAGGRTSLLPWASVQISLSQAQGTGSQSLLPLRNYAVSVYDPINLLLLSSQVQDEASD